MKIFLPTPALNFIHLQLEDVWISNGSTSSHQLNGAFPVLVAFCAASACPHHVAEVLHPFQEQVLTRWDRRKSKGSRNLSGKVGVKEREEIQAYQGKTKRIKAATRGKKKIKIKLLALTILPKIGFSIDNRARKWTGDMGHLSKGAEETGKYVEDACAQDSHSCSYFSLW